MPFVIFGRDGDGALVKRVDSASRTAEDARREAIAAGLRVTVVAADASRPDVMRSECVHGGNAGDTLKSEALIFRRELDEITPAVYVTHALIAVNFLIFTLMAMSGVSVVSPKTHDLLLWGANYGPATLTAEPWRLLTSVFVHIGFVHVASNMLVFAYAGTTVERMFGNAGFLLIYLVSGLAGSLWALFWNPLQIEAGASGAIFGTYGALLAMLFRDRGSIPPHIAARLLRLAGIFVLYNLLNSLRPGISMAAHIGGLAAGFTIGFALARPLSRSAASGRGLREIVAVGASTLSLMAALALIGTRYPNIDRVEMAIRNFAEVEGKVPEAVRTLDAKADRIGVALKHDSLAATESQVTGRDVAEGIEHELLPQWNAARETLDAVKPMPESMRSDVDSILDYMSQRAQNWQELANARRTRDRAAIEEAESRMRDIDRVARYIARLPLVRLMP